MCSVLGKTDRRTGRLTAPSARVEQALRRVDVRLAGMNQSDAWQSIRLHFDGSELSAMDNDVHRCYALPSVAESDEPSIRIRSTGTHTGTHTEEESQTFPRL